MNLGGWISAAHRLEFTGMTVKIPYDHEPHVSLISAVECAPLPYISPLDFEFWDFLDDCTCADTLQHYQRVKGHQCQRVRSAPFTDIRQGLTDAKERQPAGDDLA